MGILRGARSWEYLGSLTDNLETSPTWLEMKMFSKKREYNARHPGTKFIYKKKTFKPPKSRSVFFGGRWMSVEVASYILGFGQRIHLLVFSAGRSKRGEILSLSPFFIKKLEILSLSSSHQEITSCHIYCKQTLTNHSSLC